MDEQRKIIEALETIKSVCKNTGNCGMCPFYNPCASNDCAITDTIPENWAINKPGEVWRALN